MSRTKLMLALLLAGPLAAASAYGQLPTQPYLYGTWEGVMTVIPQQEDGRGVVLPLDGAERFSFRLGIGDTNLVLYFQTGPDEWLAIGEGADLLLNQAQRSAIVVAAMSDGQGGRPTETWMVNIVRWDEENISVYLSQVTARDEATGAPPTTFGAFGQMQRISNE